MLNKLRAVDIVYFVKELKLFQKTKVIFIEQAHIVDFIAHHGNSFKTYSESETCVFIWIYAAVFQNLLVNHT